MIISQPRVELPEPIEPQSANLYIYSAKPETDPNYISYLLQHVTFREIQLARKKNPKRNRPQSFAVTNDGNKSALHLWPTPDKTYHAMLRYCPAMKEL